MDFYLAWRTPRCRPRTARDQPISSTRLVIHANEPDPINGHAGASKNATGYERWWTCQDRSPVPCCLPKEVRAAGKFVRESARVEIVATVDDDVSDRCPFVVGAHQLQSHQRAPGALTTNERLAASIAAGERLVPDLPQRPRGRHIPGANRRQSVNPRAVARAQANHDASERTGNLVVASPRPPERAGPLHRQ